MKYFFLIVLLNILFTATAQTNEAFLQLHVQRFSCGGKVSITFNIYKENGVLSANYNSEGSNGSKELMIAAMTPNQINIIRKFIKELKSLKQEGACTTYSFYTLLQEGKKIERFDGNCEWHGIERLFQALSSK